MDNLTHSLVGLASAKAGLDRLSPYATTVCLISANIADADFVTLFFGDRWTLLQHHRGITHSILGTIAIGLLVPLIAIAIEQALVRIRKRSSRIRFGGLLAGSMAAAATHPLLDWTNNYGLRPLLPWNGRWFYGDLVFIADPYIWLVLGGVMFLLTSNRKLKLIGYSLLGLSITTFIGLAAWRSGPGDQALRTAFVAWLVGIIVLAGLRRFGGAVLPARPQIGHAIARAALCLLVVYWGTLAVAHHSAFANTNAIANNVATSRGEHLLRAVTMPTLATPFYWQSVAETDRAMYRFGVEVGGDRDTPTTVRYEKPTGQSAEVVAAAERDRRAQVLLGFARFPLARVTDVDCVGQTLVQFADLRYTEPGAPRGNFSVNISVDCPATVAPPGR